MPTSPSIETAAAWTGWGAVAATVLTLVIRFLMKTFRTDRLEHIVVNADAATYKRLQDEIGRLEKIIINMQKKYEELEARLNQLRDIELDDIADIATLSVLIAQMPCGKCENQDDLFRQAENILHAMNARKRTTQSLMNGENNVP